MWVCDFVVFVLFGIGTSRLARGSWLLCFSLVCGMSVVLVACPVGSHW